MKLYLFLLLMQSKNRVRNDLTRNKKKKNGFICNIYREIFQCRMT